MAKFDRLLLLTNNLTIVFGSCNSHSMYIYTKDHVGPSLPPSLYNNNKMSC